MKPHTPDTGAIEQTQPSAGTLLIKRLEAHALLVYPDHAESRYKMVMEMAAQAFDAQQLVNDAATPVPAQVADLKGRISDMYSTLHQIKVLTQRWLP